MDGTERFFVALTIVGLTGLFATLIWSGLIYFGAIGAGN
jgi:hypothetical protein